PAAMPRRPKLALRALLDPAGPGPLLFEGAADEALRKDIDRLPLSTAHLRRSLELDVAQDGTALTIIPRHTLARGSLYTSALPRSALAAAVRSTSSESFAYELHTADGPNAGAAVSSAF